MDPSSLPTAVTDAVPPTLLAGALSLLLHHDLTGCAQAGRQAADLLDRLAEQPGLDGETRRLCDRMATQLSEGMARRLA